MICMRVCATGFSMTHKLQVWPLEVVVIVIVDASFLPASSFPLCVNEGKLFLVGLAGTHSANSGRPQNLVGFTGL
jgi:hypothetical protein